MTLNELEEKLKTLDKLTGKHFCISFFSDGFGIDRYNDKGHCEKCSDLESHEKLTEFVENLIYSCKEEKNNWWLM